MENIVVIRFFRFHILVKAGFQDKQQSLVVFVDLSAANGTVWKQELLLKCINIFKCRE